MSVYTQCDRCGRHMSADGAASVLFTRDTDTGELKRQYDLCTACTREIVKSFSFANQFKAH